MRVEFAYAQARAQARGSAVPDTATWRVLESSRTLAQYLHACRATALAPLVSHFTGIAVEFTDVQNPQALKRHFS